MGTRQNGLTSVFFVVFFFFFFFFLFFVVFFCFLLFFFIFFCCKDPAQTVWIHMHILVWNFVGHMFSWTPSHISCKSFFYCKDPKTLIRLHRCTCICWYSAGQMFRWHHFIFHLSLLSLQKSWPAHISLTLIYCNDPDQPVWMLIILSFQTSLIPHSTWDNK